jgi:hypothetical protein
MAAYNISDVAQLQSWFIAHFAHYLASKGKRTIGWDEILQGGLPDGTLVMSWRGTEGGIDAAKLGHQVVMAPEDKIYLDRGQFAGYDQYEYFGGLNSLYTFYSYDPTDGVGEEYEKFIIGAQWNLWTEYVWGTDDLQWKIFPRVSALAEILWTRKENLDWNSFFTRQANVEAKRLRLLYNNPGPVAVGLTATWETDEIPSHWVLVQWPISGSIGSAMTYQIAFVYESGANGIQIKNVKLFIDGVLAGTDTHEGIAFDPPTANIWTTAVNVSGTGKKAYITANVQGISGSDSNGKIYVYSI